MSNKINTYLFAGIAKTLSKLTGTSGNEVAAPSASSADDLHRLVVAMERIATTLEKLVDEQTLPIEEDYWITLPAAQPSSAKNAQIVQPPSTNMAKQPPTNKSTTGQAAKISKASGITPSPIITKPKNGLLIKYLKEHNITIQEPKKKLTPQQQAYQINLEELALNLGNNFAVCQELYKLIKKNMIAPRNTFNYSLIGATAQQNTTIRQFCQLLKDVQLLETFIYQGKPNFSIELKATGIEQKYLNGSWLEKFTQHEIKRIVQNSLPKLKGTYEVLLNLDITFDDSTKTELDLFFAFGGKILCVETKTKPSEKDLTDYLTKIKPLNLQPKQILIVVADRTVNDCNTLTQQLGVQVLGLTNFEQEVKVWLETALK